MSSVTPGLAPNQSVVIPLPPSPTALARVRARFRELLAGCPDAVVDDAVQVMDALVTSAYQHGQAPRHVRITQLTNQARLHIEVDRASPPSPAMLLIHRLTSAWAATAPSELDPRWLSQVIIPRKPNGARSIQPVPADQRAVVPGVTPCRRGSTSAAGFLLAAALSPRLRTSLPGYEVLSSGVAQPAGGPEWLD